MPPPLNFHALSLKPSKFQKNFPFLVFNTGSILIGPSLKSFLPTPLQLTENHATGHDLVDNPFMRPKDTEMIANISSFERMEAAINEFQPFKAPGPDGLYPVLLQKAWNQLKGFYHVIFQACMRCSYVPSAWKEGTGIFLPKPGKESYFEAISSRMITLTSFQLKWLERLFMYHINEDNNVQAKLSTSQYGFRAGISTETALHEFVRRVEN